MTEKELKKLNRTELLELLLLQTRETERLAKKLEKAESMLADRQLKVDQAGDLAHAVLEVNGVMQAAQEAARQYLENIARMEQETVRRCETMLRQAKQEADRICRQANITPPEAVSEQELFRGLYAISEKENG